MVTVELFLWPWRSQRYSVRAVLPWHLQGRIETPFMFWIDIA